MRCPLKTLPFSFSNLGLIYFSQSLVFHMSIFLTVLKQLISSWVNNINSFHIKDMNLVCVCVCFILEKTTQLESWLECSTKEMFWSMYLMSKSHEEFVALFLKGRRNIKWNKCWLFHEFTFSRNSALFQLPSRNTFWWHFIRVFFTFLCDVQIRFWEDFSKSYTGCINFSSR